MNATAHPPLRASGSCRFAATGAIVCLALLFASTLPAQVTLTGTGYAQDFNALGSGGLPAGWSVATGATASSLGTAQTFTTGAVSWATATGNFRNVAASTGQTSAASSTTQGN